MSTEIYTFTAGAERGHRLRVVDGQRDDGPVVETCAPGSDRWSAAPLRHLARTYPVGEGPWPWLRERGVRRPSPSGSRSASQPAAERSTRAVRVSLEAYERLRQTAEAVGVPLSLAATTAVLAGCEVMRRDAKPRKSRT